MPILLPNGEIIEPIIIHDNENWTCSENFSSGGEETSHVQEEPLIWCNGPGSSLQLVNPHLKEKDESNLEQLSGGDCEIVSISSEEDSDVASNSGEDCEIEPFEDVKKENKLFVKIEEGIRKSGGDCDIASNSGEDYELEPFEDVKKENKLFVKIEEGIRKSGGDCDIASNSGEDYELEPFEDEKKENKLFVKIEEGIRKSGGDLPLLRAEAKIKELLKDIKWESVPDKTEIIEHKPVITLQPKYESVALREPCQETSSSENSSSYTVKLRPRRKKVLCRSGEDSCEDCPSCKMELRSSLKQKPKSLSSAKSNVRLPKGKKIQKTNKSNLSCSVGMHKVKRKQKNNKRKIHSTLSGHTSPINPKIITFNNIKGTTDPSSDEIKKKHRTSEKDRRVILKDNFVLLQTLVPSLSGRFQNLVPSLCGRLHAPKIQILSEATAYITQLKIESRLLYKEVCELRKVESKLYDRIDMLCSLK